MCTSSYRPSAATRLRLCKCIPKIDNLLDRAAEFAKWQTEVIHYTSPDGKRLLVVTASQTIYIVDTSP
jgi:hypothetical protein